MKIQTTKIFKTIDTVVKQGYSTISLQGSARSSKTYNTLIWLILYCLNHPNTYLSIVRKTLPALKASAFLDFKEILTKLQYFNRKSLNKSDMTYTFDNGSCVDFFSTDNEQKLRGRKRDILFVNEANEINFLEYKQLSMRTTKIIIIDYNPSFSDEHWISKLNQDSGTYHFITTYRDNPFLGQKQIEEIESLKTQNQSLWQIYGLGQQAEIEGLIFKNIKTVKVFPDCKHEYIGIDFGYANDPTAIVRVGINGKYLYLDEIAYNTQLLTADIISILKEQCKNDRIISESADPRLVQEIYRAGLNIHPVVKYKGSIEAGLQKMQEYSISVTERATNIYKELKNYTYQQDKEGKWLNQPIDKFNHAVDAVRYVILSEVLGGNKRPLNYSAILDAIR